MKNKFVVNNQPKDLIRQNSDLNFEYDNTKKRQMREMKSLNKQFEPKKKHFFFQQGQKLIGDYRFDPKKEIGNGYSSKVYKAISRKDNKEYAIKALQLINFKPSQFEMLQNEIRILKKVSHPNIIRFYNVIKTKTHLYIVTEFCSKGDLLTYMTRKGIFSQKEALQIFTDILKGMQYLFKLGIIHRDIKPGNILYDGKSWKIADFGFSLQSKEEIKTRNNVGTPLYMPIESLEKNTYSPQSDIFSLGVLFYELLIGITPWQCRDEEQLMRKLKKVQFKIPQKFNVSDPIKQLLTKLCQPLRQNRMNKKQFCLLNSIEIKRSSIQASLVKKSIVHQSQKQFNSPLTTRDLPQMTFNFQSSLQHVPSLVKFKTQTNFFTTGKMKKSSQNNKSQTKQKISKIKSTSNLPPNQIVQNVNAEENHTGKSILIIQNYQKFNKNILILMLNFSRFMFYLMKNAQHLELNQFNRVKIKLILIKHSLFLLRHLTDTKKNWFGLQNFEPYLQTKSYYKLYSSFQDYLSKYEREYQNILRKVDEQTLRQVSQKLPQLMRDDIHCSNQSFYKRLISFIAPILRQNNHNLALEILHKKKTILQTKQKIQAIKNFLKYYNSIETLSKQGGLYQLQADQIQVVKSYQETKASVQQFMNLRKQMKYI